MSVRHPDLERLLEAALSWTQGERPEEGTNGVWAAGLPRGADEVVVVPIVPPLEWSPDLVMTWIIAGAALWDRRNTLRATVIAARKGGGYAIRLEHLDGTCRNVWAPDGAPIEVARSQPSTWRSA